MKSVILSLVMVLLAACTLSAESWQFNKGTYTHREGVRVTRYETPPVTYTRRDCTPRYHGYHDYRYHHRYHYPHGYYYHYDPHYGHGGWYYHYNW